MVMMGHCVSIPGGRRCRCRCHREHNNGDMFIGRKVYIVLPIHRTSAHMQRAAASCERTCACTHDTFYFQIEMRARVLGTLHNVRGLQLRWRGDKSATSTEHKLKRERGVWCDL